MSKALKLNAGKLVAVVVVAALAISVQHHHLKRAEAKAELVMQLFIKDQGSHLITLKRLKNSLNSGEESEFLDKLIALEEHTVQDYIRMDSTHSETREHLQRSLDFDPSGCWDPINKSRHSDAQECAGAL